MTSTALGDPLGSLYPHLARTAPAHTPGGFKELGVGAMAQSLGARRAAQHGHWCRRCEGIWWGLPLEAQCPVCGHRGP